MTGALLVYPEMDVQQCADLLALASDVLPVVDRGGLVLCGDLYTALYQAAQRLELGGDRGERLVVASQAHDSFVVYLVGAGLVTPEASLKQTLRTWLVTVADHDPARVGQALATAARYWRATTPQMSSPEALIGAVGR